MCSLLGTELKPKEMEEGLRAPSSPLQQTKYARKPENMLRSASMQDEMEMSKGAQAGRKVTKSVSIFPPIDASKVFVYSITLHQVSSIAQGLLWAPREIAENTIKRLFILQ